MKKIIAGGRVVVSPMRFFLVLFFILCSFVFVATASAQSWIVQHSGHYVHCIRAVDENIVWAGARDGVYLRTTNGGTTWTTGVVSGAENITFFSIVPMNKDTAYFMGDPLDNIYDARIYKTSDGGKNWTLQYRNTKQGALLNAIAFWDQNNGIAFSDPVDGSFLILTTANGGTSWEQVPAANIPPLIPGESGGDAGSGGTALTVQGANHAWFGTTYGVPLRVFRTTDRGRTWTASNTPLSTSGSMFGISTLAFKDSLNGFVGGGDVYATSNTLAKTTDGGRTWTLVPGFLRRSPSTIVYVPQTGYSVLVATAFTGGSGYSLDGGTTWIPIGSDDYTGLCFVNPKTGWATGVFSRVIVKFNGNLVTSVDDQKVNQPQTFRLTQNYPNPFNAATSIGFSLPFSEVVTLKVYDLFGREIQTLVNGRRAAGSHRINFEADLLPSGVYLYRLQAGNFVEMKKMVLAR